MACVAVSNPMARASTARRRLGDVEDAPLVQPIGDQTAEGAEQEQRDENCSPLAIATSTPVAVETEEDEVGLGHHLHPGAGGPR